MIVSVCGFGLRGGEPELGLRGGERAFLRLPPANHATGNNPDK